MNRLVHTSEWGTCQLREGHYVDEKGPMALWLERQGEVIAKISVNLPGSEQLPERCFYLKWWGENWRTSMNVVESGWVKVRSEFPLAKSGHVTAIPVFELLEAKQSLNEAAQMMKDWEVILQKEQT